VNNNYFTCLFNLDAYIKSNVGFFITVNDEADKNNRFIYRHGRSKIGQEWGKMLKYNRVGFFPGGLGSFSPDHLDLKVYCDVALCYLW